MLARLTVNRESIADRLNRFGVHALAQLFAGFARDVRRVFLNVDLDQFPRFERTA